MTRWEYTCVVAEFMYQKTKFAGEYTDRPIADHLNEWGADGWELVQVVRNPGVDLAVETFFFKRPVGPAGVDPVEASAANA